MKQNFKNKKSSKRSLNNTSRKNLILKELLKKGCRLAEPGEFTKRAFLNGRIDLTQAEGIMDLINSKTEKARNLAINQLDGKVSNLINELRNAGAEAISVNGERIVNTSDIAQISSTIIKVNSKNISSPYEIKAIGDETYLKSALTIKNGYYDVKTKNGYEIKVIEEKNIKINKYSKSLNLKYIELN